MENSSPTPTNVAYFSDGNVLRDMGRAEGRLDGHDRELKEVKDAIQKLQEEKKVSPSDFEKLKADVSKLKEWRSYVLGAAAVVVLGISIGATIATKILFTSPSP